MKSPGVKLAKVIRSGKRLVIYLHDNPDPDAIASGWILQTISQFLGVPAVVVHGGKLGRAENRTMVSLLRIPLRDLKQKPIRHLKTDRYALVDSQPGTGNNSFPHDKLPSHIIIDHHPRRASLRADFLDVRPDLGCCTTMLLGHQRACRVPMNADLATAAVYAIISETQDLDRDATRADRQAHARLFPHVRQRVLGRIRHPARQRGYYLTMARAMHRVMLARNTCICHIGQVHAPEEVAEIADFLVAMERVTWCLVSGFHQKTMVVSIRSTDHDARAEKVMKHVLGTIGRGGGHDMIAGGALPCENLDRYGELADLFGSRFLKTRFGGKRENLRPLLDQCQADPPNRV